MNFNKDVTLKEIPTHLKEIKFATRDLQFISDGNKIYQLDGDKYVEYKNDKLPSTIPDGAFESGYVLIPGPQILNLRTGQTVKLQISQTGPEKLFWADEQHFLILNGKKMLCFDPSGTKLWEKELPGDPGPGSNEFFYVQGDGDKKIITFNIETGKETDLPSGHLQSYKDGYMVETDDNKRIFYDANGKTIGKLDGSPALLIYLGNIKIPTVSEAYQIYKNFQDSHKNPDRNKIFRLYLASDGTVTTIEGESVADGRQTYKNKEINECIVIGGVLAEQKLFYCLEKGSKDLKTSFYNLENNQKLFDLDFDVQFLIYNPNGNWLVMEGDKIYQVKGL